MIVNIRRYFVTGLLTILPLSISIYILFLLFKFVDNILGRFLNAYLRHILGFYIPGLGLILFVLLIFLTGILSTHLFGAKLHNFLERAAIRFPLLKHIYPSLKKMFEFAFSDTRAGFKKAVLVEYPSKGIWSLAFLANDGPLEAEGKLGKELLNVYVPSVPNPATGYFVIVPKDEVKMLDMSIKDAMKLVMSGGILNPSEFTKENHDV